MNTWCNTLNNCHTLALAPNQPQIKFKSKRNTHTHTVNEVGCDKAVSPSHGRHSHSSPVCFYTHQRCTHHTESCGLLICHWGQHGVPRTLEQSTAPWLVSTTTCPKQTWNNKRPDESRSAGTGRSAGANLPLLPLTSAVIMLHFFSSSKNKSDMSLPNDNNNTRLTLTNYSSNTV